MSAIVAAVAGAGVFGSVVTAAQAADKNWTSTAPTAWWSDGNNWWAPGVPGAGDKAIIVNRNSAPQTVYYANSNGGNFMLSGLTLNAESTGDLNFVMRADTPHTLRSSITSIGSTDWVTFRQEGGNHEVGTMFQLGFGGTNGKATYELLNNSTLRTYGDAYIGGGARAEFSQQHTSNHIVEGTMYLSSGSTNVQNLYKLYGGTLTTGALRMDFGNTMFDHGWGTVNAGTLLTVAEKAGSIGFYDMWQGTTLTAGSAHIAELGSGSLNQRGGYANFGTLDVGRGAGSQGQYNLLGSGTLVTNLTIVGDGGRGSFFQDGGHHKTREMRIANTANQQSSYFVAQGAKLEVTEKLVIGHGGTAAFNQNGGTVSVNGPMVIGDLGPAHGNYGMSWGNLSASHAVVGNFGSGTLTMTAGEANLGSGIALGATANGKGWLNVSGGTLTVGNISVGSGGAGTVTQSNGSANASFVLYVGDGTGTTGRYTLSDGTLTTRNEYVGLYGNGIFTQSGGTHTVTDKFGLKSFPSAAGTYNMQGGVFSAGSAELHGMWNQTGGTATFGTTYASGHVKVGPGATFSTRHMNNTGLLDVAGGTVRIDDGQLRTEMPSKTRGLLFSGPATGKLDVTDLGMVLDYAGGEPDPLPMVVQKILSGRNGGTWDGSGIISSEADADHGVGYAAGAALVGAGGQGLYQGMPFDDTSVLFGFARYGDANLDGQVDLADFNALASGFGKTAQHWFQGDFTYDGIVNLADFNQLAQNFGLSAGPDGVVDAGDWAALGAAVPEPTSLGVACAAAALALPRPRRRRR